MAKTTLDTMKAEGAQILEMMESVPKPSPTSAKGSVVDTRA
jgi:superfamily II RNA helicase